MPRLIILLLLCTIFSGCSSTNCYDYTVYGADEFIMDSYCINEGKLCVHEMQGCCEDDLPDEALCEYKDTVAEDDILDIVFHHPTRHDLAVQLNSINNKIGFRVRNGMVDIPDLDPIQVEGLTLDETRDALQSAFRQQVEDIELFVNYRDRLQRKVQLAGMVSVPTIPVDGKIRLFEVLALAGTNTQANWYQSYVLRNGCPLPIDLNRLVVQGDMCQNIVMRGGDQIYVADPNESKVMIMGEVGLPRTIAVPRGKITLREALVEARGIPFTGNKRCIQVIRGELPCPKVYRLCWDHVIGLPNHSLMLMPGDTVYVSETPITKWNRFISQILPSIHGLQAGYLAYELFNPND